MRGPHPRETEMNQCVVELIVPTLHTRTSNCPTQLGAVQRITEGENVYPLVPWAELRRRVGLFKVSTAVPWKEKYRHTDAQTLAFVCLCEMFFTPYLTPKLSVVGLCARDILYDHLLLSEGFVLENLISAIFT